MHNDDDDLLPQVTQENAHGIHASGLKRDFPVCTLDDDVGSAVFWALGVVATKQDLTSHKHRNAGLWPATSASSSSLQSITF